jgi:hypothetical protein
MPVRRPTRLEEARHDCPLVIAVASGTLLDCTQRVVGQPRPVLTRSRRSWQRWRRSCLRQRSLTHLVTSSPHEGLHTSGSSNT